MSHSPADHPLGVDGSVELALLERNGLIESRHLGAAVVVPGDGSVVRTLGDTGALIYPRSSLKPLQAIAVARAGAVLDGEQLVLSTASHAGTPEHVRVVEEILAQTALDEAALQCPLDWPGDPDSAAVARTTDERRRVTMNCSGKHAAFLLACVRNGWPTENYLDPEHPLQLLIRSTVEEFTGEEPGHLGIDGCGAPLFAVTLRGLATAISLVAQGLDPDAARLTHAIIASPWAIDGPGRPNTVVIEELGLLAKGGAEGVMVMAARDGTAVALKILDGSHRATSLIALQLLAQAGAISGPDAERVSALTTEKVLGKGEPVGSIRVTF